MTVMLDELIKWILTQYDDGMTEEQRLSICRRLMSEASADTKEENGEQE